MKKTNKWAVFFCVFIGSITIAINQFKVPPLMTSILESMSLNNAQGGMLMTAYAIAVGILIIPGAYILTKLGGKRTTLLALFCSAVGSAVGAFAGSLPLLMVSRCIEGIGSALIAVAMPTIVAGYFAPEERGKPMGIQAGFIPVAALITYVTAVPLQNLMSGLKGVWIVTAILPLVMLIICLAVVKDQQTEGAEEAPAPAETPSVGRVLKNPMIWVLALCFFGCGVRDVAFSTWTPTFFQQNGMTAAMAGTMGGIGYLGFWIGTTLGGTLIDKKISPRKIMLISGIGLFIVSIWCFSIPMSIAAPYIILIGLFAGPIITTIYTLIPMAVQPQDTGYGMAIGNLALTLAQLGAPIVSGAVLDRWGFGKNTIVVEVGAAAIIVAGLLIQKCKGASE